MAEIFCSSSSKVLLLSNCLGWVYIRADGLFKVSFGAVILLFKETKQVVLTLS